jgi:hypothetical protein
MACTTVPKQEVDNCQLDVSAYNFPSMQHNTVLSDSKPITYDSLFKADYHDLYLAEQHPRNCVVTASTVQFSQKNAYTIEQSYSRSVDLKEEKPYIATVPFVLDSELERGSSRKLLETLFEQSFGAKPNYALVPDDGILMLQLPTKGKK